MLRATSTAAQLTRSYLQFISEPNFLSGLFLFGRRSDSQARVACVDKFNKSPGITFEGVGTLRKIEPFSQDRMLPKTWKLGPQAVVMFVIRAHQHTLPRFTLRG